MGNSRSILLGDHCAMILTGLIHVMTEPRRLPLLPGVQCCAGNNKGSACAVISFRLCISLPRCRKKPLPLSFLDLTKDFGRLIRELVIGSEESLNTQTSVKVLCSAAVRVSVVHHVVQKTERFGSVHEQCDVDDSVRQVARTLHVGYMGTGARKVKSAPSSRQGCKLGAPGFNLSYAVPRKCVDFVMRAEGLCSVLPFYPDSLPVCYGAPSSRRVSQKKFAGRRLRRRRGLLSDCRHQR